MVSEYVFKRTDEWELYEMTNEQKFKTVEERATANTKSTRSTACYKNKRATRIMHGLYRENRRLFGVWDSMINRCENKNRTKYKDYDGWRGNIRWNYY